ncbi:hypothetical protein WICPIJ_002125 [Wickerhamomyces pijperi]|uniref:Uncharacterized protein n=1 Tax=Wickerhamomyces pijperi TaxID=599730 RepID=A0A9P8QCE3_WICPI|nr:hypothetical protein WICPIJ_002125 [Wickerhamomyces pijperi]
MKPLLLIPDQALTAIGNFWSKLSSGNSFKSVPYFGSTTIASILLEPLLEIGVGDAGRSEVSKSMKSSLLFALEGHGDSGGDGIDRSTEDLEGFLSNWKFKAACSEEKSPHRTALLPNSGVIVPKFNSVDEDIVCLKTMICEY